MFNRIKNFIDRLSSNQKIRTFDEASTKQAIVLPVLDILGWCTYDVDEVLPEYSVENRRVDYALRLNSSNEFFIEVKNTGEDLEKHEEQLLDYSFRQGVQLGALTNGITWWFYLPTKKGDWKTRKFYTIDILKQETDDVAQKFIDLLSRENVRAGQALKNAESIYKSRVKERTLKDTIPEAWNAIISEPDTLIVDLIAETTERLCGFKPSDEEVKTFVLNINREVFLSTTSIEERKPNTTPFNQPKSKQEIRSFQTLRGSDIHTKEKRNGIPWPIAVEDAIRRMCNRRGGNTFDRRTLIEEELGQITKVTGSKGATPHQTLSAVLQQLRDQKIIEFTNKRGVYRLLK